MFLISVSQEQEADGSELIFPGRVTKHPYCPFCGLAVPESQANFHAISWDSEQSQIMQIFTNWASSSAEAGSEVFSRKDNCGMGGPLIQVWSTLD